MKRYALLDTDFISKTHSVQDDNGNHLIDRVMELPEYEFFCHAQIVTELNRYNADAPIWLSEKIGNQRELIQNFVAERPELHLVGEYADDGYTGTNFERPGFTQMMVQGKRQKINYKDAITLVSVI